ncbi:hypothetical protein Ddye_027022 [Dipteronia dyeriana]|uniref:TF-B3 domain-containing protein n=1 Tax=Dipteronia dyeriana TaxID=168575 RepID=A0AAD9WQY9_9ROSI|nr:hypothetical protein Ddye_027022 [Dipteronia dyeriana]
MEEVVVSSMKWSSAYEQGTVCDIFHWDDSGWRKCIICDKKLHCGCIMSVHKFTELDSGGVKCFECISNEESMVESTQGVPSQGAHFENPRDSEEPQGDAPGIYRRHLLVPILTKSDANSKNSRLVVPRKCAQVGYEIWRFVPVLLPVVKIVKRPNAFLPKLFEPKGFPITIQDPSGKEWKLRYRFWPNKSTIYVLEGMRSYYEFHQCKPGDKVAFYRIDPEGKLVLGVKKSPATSGQKGL